LRFPVSPRFLLGQRHLPERVLPSHLESSAF
jgi:hypothetical protein